MPARDRKLKHAWIRRSPSFSSSAGSNSISMQRCPRPSVPSDDWASLLSAVYAGSSGERAALLSQCQTPINAANGGIRAKLADGNIQKPPETCSDRRHRNSAQRAKNDGDAFAPPLPLADRRPAASWLPLLRQVKARRSLVLRLPCASRLQSQAASSCPVPDHLTPAPIIRDRNRENHSMPVSYGSIAIGKCFATATDEVRQRDARCVRRWHIAFRG